MNKLYELYQQEYVSKEKCIQTDPSIEMKIVLKHDQTISYKTIEIVFIIDKKECFTIK